jgi:hypothetical protein
MAASGRPIFLLIFPPGHPRHLPFPSNQFLKSVTYFTIPSFILAKLWYNVSKGYFDNNSLKFRGKEVRFGKCKNFKRL